MKTEQDVADRIRQAYDQGQKLRIISGGTRQGLGNSTLGAPLDVSGLNGVSLYEPGALTIVAGAGTPLDEIEKTLAKSNQRLPFEPMDHQALLGTKGVPTIGGVVACNISGSARIQAGACRDSLIGVRFVDGAGNIVKNGGRVMKNVTGYDLVKLMAGSMGSLGVLTEVAFKVLPKPETKACILIHNLTDEQATAAMATALGSPYDVSGAAHIPVGIDGHPVTMIRVEGFEKSVSYRAAKLAGLLSHFGTLDVETDPDRVQAGWKWVRDVESFADKSGDVWRISVKPSDGPLVRARLENTDCVYDWAGGLVWALTPAGYDVRSKLVGIAGSCERVRGEKGSPSIVPQNELVGKLEQELRCKFDPNGILNAGIMG